MNEASKDISILQNYVVTQEKEVDEALKKQLNKLNRKIIVLDDDPTGIQTVNEVSVYTEWSKESILKGFKEKNNMFFILTNSRALTEAETAAVHKEIAENIVWVSRETGKEFILISRGDSTLRGHFPLETKTLREEIEKNFDIKYSGEIIMPFFKEGGRYTLDNVHYVKYDSSLVPAGETEFSKDKTFGFSSSHLGEWCQEKSNGKNKVQDMVYITLEDLRSHNKDVIIKKLLEVENFDKIIVNAIDYYDVKIFTNCLIDCILEGKEFIYRTAAAFPKIIGGVNHKDLLTRKDIISKDNSNGGIILVGSHVKKTTLQLEYMMNNIQEIEFIEFDVSKVSEEGGLESEVERVLKLLESTVLDGRTVTVYTSRKLLQVETEDKNKILEASVKISNSLVNIIGKLSVRPSFIIAKGGITSSDVGTKALQVKKAKVMGQVKPGIPVWMTGDESKFPEMPYVIFPGNVGETSTLGEIAEMLIEKGEANDDHQ
ncbi:hypothetical protein CACET_c30680 [Clostridium aceticum]|uniref:Uncharacterized protein n=1 Tax=Clostridium aceticum TaxID=84022 RepID=A0A0D8IAL3_9CLOT|nr:four-carbon acid sugar kinase family protein [Clostridium aceticum]AKL96512.1 hypothetical protein CACET_c30680 [Clostridium aceticum]KJF27318.1 hydroxyacid dehydrogenase [Clostridium aceticum]